MYELPILPSTLKHFLKKVFLLPLFIFAHMLHAQTIVPAGLGSMNAIQPDRESAILSANLLRTGGQNPTVKIVWGDEDG
ncbi:MAG: hypothetical protein P8P49_03895, partial [Opitutales bacterium]|nr:hypothetical protein [Opitutales bacterium]